VSNKSATDLIGEASALCLRRQSTTVSLPDILETSDPRDVVMSGRLIDRRKRWQTS
jgi:hypothetical protein